MVVLPSTLFAPGLPSTYIAVLNRLWVIGRLDILGSLRDDCPELRSNKSVVRGEVLDSERFRSYRCHDVETLGKATLDLRD
jgi:hypothetical protein